MNKYLTYKKLILYMIVIYINLINIFVVIYNMQVIIDNQFNNFFDYLYDSGDDIKQPIKEKLLSIIQNINWLTTSDDINNAFNKLESIIQSLSENNYTCFYPVENDDCIIELYNQAKEKLKERKSILNDLHMERRRMLSKSIV